MFDNERFKVVAFTEPQRERAVFRQRYAQHLTVAPWMRGHRLQATTRIADALRSLQPFQVEITGEAFLGAQEDIPIWSVGPEEMLQTLHTVIASAADKYGTVLESNSDDEYQPYINRYPDQPAYAVGDSLALSQLAVVGLSSQQRVIFRNIELSS